MASYQTHERDPLLDQGTQAMLERRAFELFGALVVGVGLSVGLMLWTYSPEDPSWMVATDQPIKNAFGHFGASLASTMILLAGKGSWIVPLIVMTWGMRLVLHRGAERVLTRAIFLPLAAAAASIYGATLAAGPDWPHYFGLGGLFGDTFLGVLVNLLPLAPGVGIKAMSLLFGLLMLATGFLVAGFTRPELVALGRFLGTGLRTSFRALAGAARRGAGAGMTGSGPGDARPAMAADQRDGLVRRAATPAPGDGPADWGRAAPLRADSRYPGAPADALAPGAVRERSGLMSLVPSVLRRAAQPEPELVEPQLAQGAGRLSGLPDQDRISSRIADAVRQRAAGQAGPAPAEMSEPQDPISAAIRRREAGLTRPLAAPMAVARPAAPGVRTEPPVSARPAAGLAAAAATSLAPGVASAGFVSRRAPTAAEEDADLAIATDWDAELDPDEADFIPGPDLRAQIPTGEPRRPIVQAAARKAAAPSRQALAEAQPRLRFDDPAPAYALPPLSLLSNPAKIQRHTLSNEALEENARMLESVLDDYGVRGGITSVRPGPVVTMYELEPAPGLKASRVIGLSDDIARSMSALSARVSTVPGRTVIGIELPNAVREKVVLREILSARDFGDTAMRLPLALGKDIGGEPIIANLAKMPHLLIAGTTGSGKSVAINTMILSLLYKLTPEECRLIMIDPKMLELSVYDGIPHLLSPVVTDPKKAVVALKWVVGEMEERYRKMSKMGVRNIDGYNGRVRESLAQGEMFKRTIQTGFDEDTGEPVFETEEFQPAVLPYIVVVVDEMADLMMVAGKEIEACIQRLAQMARASGIHLIMATQRPSVDVITGTIKANFPTRISFQVTSKIDSRTILGEQGAEQLLGMGDMLYMAGGGRVSRIHGPFVSDEEVEEIVSHLKSYGPPVYMSGVVDGPEDDAASEIDMVLGLGGDASDDALYDQAVAIVAKDRKCSTSYIQRKLGIGYNKAARLVEQMEEEGVVTPANHVGKREILVPER
ncbi:MAG: DNA translocase FtsK 4TM domain-containing protein [Paracoccaceae bacterium]